VCYAQAVLLRLLVASLALTSTALAQEATRARPPQVLMINGGGSAEENYSSHLAHLQQMQALLLKSGVPAQNISVFNADGADPGPDMAVHVPEPENFLFLDGTELGHRLGPPQAVESSSLPGVRAQPATRAALERWFAAARGRLRAGDTLLVYVTDHGTQNARDRLDNRIVLWGRNETLSVRQLRALLDRLDPGVRVVSLMSQCFSGGFAQLSLGATPRDVPSGRSCGYYSSTADRPAYGCYPAVAGREGVGHSFEFMSALERTGRFADAHSQVLSSDTTPDVPLRSSDVYLQELVDRSRGGAKVDAFTDQLLREAWKQRAQWEPELRLLDRIGHTFGVASPRSLAELEATRGRIVALAKQLDTHGDDWNAAMNMASEANEKRLLTAHPEWKVKAGPQALRALTDAGRRTLAAEAATALAATAKETGRAERFKTLAARNTMADEAGYRMEVRLAALLRMSAVLTDIAGRVQLARASAAERASYEALRRCEELALPRPAAPDRPAPPANAFPPLEDELRVVQQVIPGWMGIAFDDERPSPRRKRLKLDDGPALVTAVLPSSPAQAAGLAVGDVVLGPPGDPFTQHGDIKAWTMLLAVDKPQPIAVLRGPQALTLTLTPRPRPVELPRLGAPKVSTPAPPVYGAPYRGTAPAVVAAKGPFLLIFWATWCQPCKESLPEVLAFARERRVPIMAVTDEGKGELDAFFARWKQPFPEHVISDEDRLSFASYGVSGTPTIVYVDGGHIVRSYTVGYSRPRGLLIEGWHWDGR
jgi:thiol-disulfide isomerase/thioredoxin